VGMCSQWRGHGAAISRSRRRLRQTGPIVGELEVR
jgi:hypothetical protein